MQTIWGDDDRFVKQYYSKYCQNPESKDWHDWPYFAADAAVLPTDGYYRILGRVDDVNQRRRTQARHKGARVRVSDDSRSG